MCLFQKYLQSIKIILIQNRLLGISVFAPKETFFEKSQTGVVIDSLAVLLYPTYCIYTCYLKLTENESTVFKLVETVMIIANGVYATSVWLFAIKRCEQMQRIFTKTIKFDRELQEIGVSINYRKQQRRDLIQLIIRALVVFAVSFYVLVVRVYLGNKDLHSEIIRITAHVYKTTTCHLITHLASTIRLRYVILNGILNKLIHRQLQKGQMRIEDAGILGKIRELYQELGEFVQHFNAIFSTQLLVFFGMSFVKIAVAVFFTVFSAFFRSITLLNFGVLFYFLCYTIDVIHICVSCTGVVEEANTTRRLFLSVQSDRRLEKEIKRFLVYGVAADVQFTAANLFVVDNTLIVAMFAGVVVYSLILIQSTSNYT